MKRLLLFLLVILSVGSWGQALDPGLGQVPVPMTRLSGYVRSLLDKHRRHSPAARASDNAPSKRRLTAFVCTDVQHADSLWAAFGCKAYAQLGDIAVVDIPMNRLEALSLHPAVRRIEASPSGRLAMDTTTAIVRALPLYAPSAIHPAFTGRDVVVGVMDVGFDLTHPNFYDAMATHYRIGAFWDQLSKDTIGSPWPVGRDFRGYEAVRAQAHSYDGLKQTHGTHTLGIAAGSGYDSPYRGIAFESDICLVSNAVSDDIELIDSADIAKYTTAVDALGFKYIFDYADSLGKPCVASFSEGYPPYLDQEDSLFAAFLDKLSTPGHIIVASAGNESLAKTYLPKPQGKAEAGAFLNAGKKEAYYRIKANGKWSMRLLAYGDKSGSPTDMLEMASGDIPSDSVLTDMLRLGTDSCKVTLERYASAFDADTLYALSLRSDTLLSVMPIALVAEGEESRVEVFGTSTHAFKADDADSRWADAQSGHNIHAPACFPAVICVGATAHRLSFTNYEGVRKDYSRGYTSGRRSTYSSTGPTIAGLLKPDVTAPGNNVVSSYSSYYLEANPEARDISSDVAHFDFEGRTYAWNANTGTSMSAPVVAGVIALWLQARPSLTTQEVRQVLSRTCRHPEPSLEYPNHEYGYGEIDAYAGLLDILGVDKIEGVSSHQPRQLRLACQGRQLKIVAGERLSAPLQLKVYSLSGQLLSTYRVEPGIATELSVSLPVMQAGLYVVQVESRDSNLCGSQIINLREK